MKTLNNTAMSIDSIKIPTHISSLSIVEKHIDSLCQNLSVAERCYGNVLIAVTEAVNNAIIHGNKNDESKEVTLNYYTEKKSLVFQIKDEGNGFDYENLPDPTDPVNIEKLHGRGVFLMKNLADDVAFEENGKSVTLSFHNFDND
ncbi:ATP-binding protein [Acidiluteibacter ferrifornacis]|nr:ATP-binding protein [Acidiluteibacter ferrifornacis]